MENATKALLIAAAVLVAILIISLGLIVYNMASETIDSVDFSGQEITAFNDKFEQYEGQQKRGSEVNAMFRTVLNSNLQMNAQQNTTNLVTVDGVCGTLSGSDINLSNINVDTSRLYQIVVDHDLATGFVNMIHVN